MPMPTSATARINPNVNTDPPSRGTSIRYHTSSIRKNAKPTMPDAVSTNPTGACACATAGDEAGSFGVEPRVRST